MPTATFKNTLTTGQSVENVFTGSQWEILTSPAEIAIAIISDGGAVGDIVATVLSGTDTLGEEQPVSTANRTPVFPDDFAFNDIAAAMDRLKVRLRNTSASTRIVTTQLRINPL